MTDQKIQQLAKQYRAAIEAASDDGRFSTDISFKNFPHGCCGDASYLLAEYLRECEIETIWYSTRRGEWTHAWLAVKDERVKKPTPKSFSWPEELHGVLAGYVEPTVEEQFGNGQPNRTIVSLPLVQKERQAESQVVFEKQPDFQPKPKKTEVIEARAEALVALLRENPTASRGEIASELGITETQIRTALKHLKKKKRIYHEGASFGGKWIIND